MMPATTCADTPRHPGHDMRNLYAHLVLELCRIADYGSPPLFTALHPSTVCFGVWRPRSSVRITTTAPRLAA